MPLLYVTESLTRKNGKIYRINCSGDVVSAIASLRRDVLVRSAYHDALGKDLNPHFFKDFL